MLCSYTREMTKHILKVRLATDEERTGITLAMEKAGVSKWICKKNPEQTADVKEEDHEKKELMYETFKAIHLVIC